MMTIEAVSEWYLNVYGSSCSRLRFMKMAVEFTVKSQDAVVEECIFSFHLRMARLCCGTWMRANTSTPWTVVTSSMPFASAPTATGYVPPPAPALRSGWVFMMIILSEWSIKGCDETFHTNCIIWWYQRLFLSSNFIHFGVFFLHRLGSPFLYYLC